MMENKKWSIVVFVIVFLLVLAGIYLIRDGNDQPSTQTDAPEFLTLTIKNTSVRAELAWTPEQRAQGLSGRQSLPAGQGMLFVFPQPETPGFWMKDMNFSIDIIWITAENVVAGVTENLTPESYPKMFYPPSPILYVLEVSAGFVKQHNIQKGDEVQTSNFGN
jgi:hypothetical protein